jgi:hypothetical protein
MRRQTAMPVVFVALISGLPLMTACNRQGPERETTTETRAAEGNAAAEAAAADRRKMDEQTAQLDKRASDLDQRFTEMEAKVADKGRTPTAGLRAEVKEDVANVHQAIANLKTTTPENWWQRHEEAMERTADDIEADVRRLAKTWKPTAAPATSAADAVFESRRDAFVTRLSARADAMEAALKDVKASGAVETEVNDTRARIDKLQDDLQRLHSVSAKDWWDVSEKRVAEYIDRVEDSVRRLDNDRAKTE